MTLQNALNYVTYNGYDYDTEVEYREGEYLTCDTFIFVEPEEYFEVAEIPTGKADLRELLPRTVKMLEEATEGLTVLFTFQSSRVKSLVLR